MIDFRELLVVNCPLHHVDQQATALQVDELVKLLRGHSSLLLHARRYVTLRLTHDSRLKISNFPKLPLLNYARRLRQRCFLNCITDNIFSALSATCFKLPSRRR